MKLSIFYCTTLFFVGCVAAPLQKGFEIKTQGTFIDKAERQKIVDLLISNPGALLSDIDFIAEEKLLNKKKELQLKLMETLDRTKKKETGQKIAKIKRMLDRQIGFIHESYIEADILNDILVKNPYLVRAFQSEVGSAEAELHHTKNEFAQAFNNLSAFIAENFLSYDEYVQFKENYKNRPFFNLLHNIRECVGCGLARMKVPFVREYLEKQVTDYVLSKFPDENKQIIITDFASGNLFQIFVLVNKLAALGYKNIRLNLIDIEFENIVERYRKQMGDYPLLIQPGTFELSRNDSDYIANLYGSFQEKIHQDPESSALPILGEDRALYVIENILFDTKINNTFARFSQWFNGSGLKLEMVIYPNAADYLADCAAIPLLKADLLIAVDYFTDLNHILEKLRSQGLKETGMAFSLDHADIDDSFKTAEFYFSKGSQKQARMDHFAWDLSTKQLKAVDHLPDTLDYELSGPQLAHIFKEN